MIVISGNSLEINLPLQQILIYEVYKASTKMRGRHINFTFAAPLHEVTKHKSIF